MQSYSVLETGQGTEAPQPSHLWHQSQERAFRPTDGIYRGLVPVSPDVALTRFAVLVKRVLKDLHDRGLSDDEIVDLTGVGKSTFHRWQSRQFGASGPQPQKVRAFFDGAGVAVKHAYDALGWVPDDETPAQPEPDIPPEVRELLRRLRDPNVPRKEREFIQETLRSLIARRTPAQGAAKPAR